MTINDQSLSPSPTASPSLPSASPITKTTTPTNTKIGELPKIQFQRFEKDTRKRRTSGQTSKRAISASKQPQSTLLPPPIVSPTPTTIPLDSIKVLPLTIFDFNGSSEYYEHMVPFIDTSALYLICIHIADFHQTAPAVIEDIFNGKFDISSSMIITQLFQLLQLLYDKATKTRAIMILPIATCIDLYDKRPKEDK
jgi:hypothetical protein